MIYLNNSLWNEKIACKWKKKNLKLSRIIRFDQRIAATPPKPSPCPRNTTRKIYWARLLPKAHPKKWLTIPSLIPVNISKRFYKKSSLKIERITAF